MADYITQVTKNDDKKPSAPRARPTGAIASMFSSLFCCWPSTSAAARRTTDTTTVTNQSWPEHPDPGTNLLPTIITPDEGKKCLVLDLDETLVHSSFKPVANADFVVPIEIDGNIHHVYVLKRPYVDEFLHRVGELFEVVLFTASLSKYADPVSDLLDIHKVFRHRLFRQHCVYHRGNYVKDLSRLGRDVSRTLIVDNSPASYIFHPENAVPVESWFDNPSDTELLELIPYMEEMAKGGKVSR